MCYYLILLALIRWWYPTCVIHPDPWRNDPVWRAYVQFEQHRVFGIVLNQNPIQTLELAVPDDPHVALLNLSMIQHRDFPNPGRRGLMKVQRVESQNAKPTWLWLALGWYHKWKVSGYSCNWGDCKNLVVYNSSLYLCSNSQMLHVSHNYVYPPLP